MEYNILMLHFEFLQLELYTMFSNQVSPDSILYVSTKSEMNKTIKSLENALKEAN